MVNAEWTNNPSPVDRARCHRLHRSNQDRDDGAIVTLAVVGAQVTRVGENLIHACLKTAAWSLEFQHDDDSPLEDHDVGAPEISGQLVFEDRRVLARSFVNL